MINLGADTNLFIGIDPDIRTITAAILCIDRLGEVRDIQVFKRKNEHRHINKDAMLSDVYREAVGLALELKKYKEAATYKDTCVWLGVESQSMAMATQNRNKGRHIRYDDIRRLSQAAGIIAGVVAAYCDVPPIFVQPHIWKGTQPKNVNQARTYKSLGITPESKKKQLSNIYPCEEQFNSMTMFTDTKINPGDFKDINDSLGIAYYMYKAILK